jgi:hypothetical protein
MYLKQYSIQLLFSVKKKEKRKKKKGGSEDKHDDGNACQKLG